MEYLPAEGQTRATPGEDGALQHGDGGLAAPMGGVLRSASRCVRDAGIREADGSPRGEHMPTMRRPARPHILLHRRADRTGEDPTREADGSESVNTLQNEGIVNSVMYLRESSRVYWLLG